MRYSESKNLKQLNTVFKDTQKIYDGKQKTALITYVQKQHNVFESDKKLGDGGVHHYIISPLSPESYEKLTPEQKKIMEEESIQWSKNTFEKYGFIGALEYNSDKSDKEYSNGFQNIKEGFHLHLAVSEKYRIRGQADLVSLRESLANHLSNNIDGDMRTILGVKNKEEMESFRRESISRTQKRNALENLKNSPEFIENDAAIKSLNGELSKVFTAFGVSHTVKNDLISMSKHERHNILSKKDDLKTEIGSLQKEVKGRRDEIKFLDRLIKDEQSSMSDTERLFNDEYIALKRYYQKDLMGFSYWAEGQHQWFRKIKSDQLKNGEIDTAQFLYQVAQNKSYWHWLKTDKKERQEATLRERQREFKARLFEMGDIIRNLQRDRLSVAAIASMDRKKLNEKLAQYEGVGKLYESHYEVFLKRIEQIQQHISKLRVKKVMLVQNKKQKQSRKQQMIEDILKLDATAGGKGFETLTKGMEKKYDVQITRGGAQPDSIDVMNKTIHIKKPKKEGAFAHLLRGIMKITNFSESSVLDSLKTKTLFRTVKKSIYAQYPTFKPSLEQAQSLEDFIVVFEKLKEVHKRREEDYSPSL
ncbi:hypothetical protein [uncultured Sulfuricurvum sp.]|uniref:hypothetical protein n=1 Tax=uncultured Sulfuricurvum sp. TaxID=430693 RepID=UPI0026037506|nr:hypothetical protein [uncultured Sulfuricurvum sp.]